MHIIKKNAKEGKMSTLVIMAAGLGSRFGGLKQLVEVDKYEHVIFDYSVFDAIRAGFSRVVFIIKPEMEEDFKKLVSKREKRWGIMVDYVFQEAWIYGITPSLIGRKKPWGTAHAVACLENAVDTPFALINADDFYGYSAFKEMHSFLSGKENCFAMVGYRLKNTLSPNGSVSRGICEVKEGLLVGIREVGEIVDHGGKILSLSENSILDPSLFVSMNFWGFTPEIITECKSYISSQLRGLSVAELITNEFYLPDVVGRLVKEGRATVRLMTTDDHWLGLTYTEDLPLVREKIGVLLSSGEYPEDFACYP